MDKVKKLLTLLCAIIFAASLSFTVSAEKINIDSWNKDSILYDVLDNTAESNSAVEYAFLRVKYDRPSNRIRFLFMLELSSFTDESNAGVTLSINGDEEITLHLNGTAEYNEDKYYAEISHLSYPMTNILYLEVTLGIKKGIPDTVNLEFNVYDTEGVASNTYCVDITETLTDTDSTDSQAQTDKTEEKTTKTKTTKVKTTKKTKTRKADNDEQALITDDEEDGSQTVIESDNTESIAENGTVISKNKVITIIVAAAVAAGGAATGITNLLKKTRTRDGG